MTKNQKQMEEEYQRGFEDAMINLLTEVYQDGYEDAMKKGEKMGAKRGKYRVRREK